MFWKRLVARSWASTDPGELARRQHEDWLTRALMTQREYPRIPIRRVDEGGFEAMMHRTDGPSKAQRWWDLALRRVNM